MPDMMANRRAFPRYPVTLRAEVVELSSGANINARTSDLSRGGCYIDTLKPFTSRSAVRVKLTQGNESFEVRAETRYVSPGFGMGLMFEEQIPARQLAILNGWLEAAAKQPA
jgi:hypothetical protein